MSFLLAREFGTRECPGRAQVGLDKSESHAAYACTHQSMFALRNNLMVCDASTDNLTVMFVQGQL